MERKEREKVKAMLDVIHHTNITLNTIDSIITEHLDYLKSINRPAPMKSKYNEILGYIRSCKYYTERRRKQFLDKFPADENQGKVEWWL